MSQCVWWVWTHADIPNNQECVFGFFLYLWCVLVSVTLVLCIIVLGKKSIAYRSEQNKAEMASNFLEKVNKIFYPYK